MPYSVPDILMLPVETLNREFDAKLLLALCAADRGLRPIIGAQAVMVARLPRLPRSIYLSKGVRSGNRRVFSWLESFGHTIAAVDEEALVPLADELHLLKLDPDCFRRVRLLFAWGEKNAALWKRSQWYAGAPVVVSGNPRTDLMRADVRSFYEPEVDELRNRFGDFVLLNTNSAMVNHFIPGRTRFSVAAWAPAEKTDRYRTELMEHKRALFEQFRAIVPAVAKAIQPRRLVIRPHPSENQEAWRQAGAGQENVVVLHEGPVVPWLMAARALVHNGCTTAVEAAAIGTPTLAFRPALSDSFEGLPNALSEDCRDLDSLIQRLRGILGGDPAGPNDEQRALLRHHLVGLDGRLCSERIVDGLLQNDSALAQAPGATWRSRMGGSWSHRSRRLIFRARDAMLGGHRASYRRYKFPGMEPRSIEARIARFRRTLGRFDGLRARQLHADMYAIERA